jgi:hypothetical protein
MKNYKEYINSLIEIESKNKRPDLKLIDKFKRAKSIEIGDFVEVTVNLENGYKKGESFVVEDVDTTTHYGVFITADKKFSENRRWVHIFNVKKH